MSTEHIGSILIDKYRIDSEVLQEALEQSRERGIRLGECLISEFGVSENAIYQAMAEQFQLPFLTSIQEKISLRLLRELPVELFNEGRCFPLYERDGTIGVVVFDPLDLDILLDVECASGMRVDVSMTTPYEMEQVWESLYTGDSIFQESAGQITEEYEKYMQLHESSRTLSKEEIMKRMESEPVVKMVNLIFNEAIDKGSSDIHVEPAEESAAIRFRVDGMLVQHMKLSKWVWIPVTSRIKILADLDIAEKRMPQDGRIAYEHDGIKYDLRVSTLPTHHGEKTVVRILKQDKRLLDLKKIGLEERELQTLSRLIEKPKGMIIVTGPTGSGKSTALFACLNQINNKAINITTIENPIEYKLNGINQVQVNEKAGLSFAATLRSILRQDPDVILIGEIRDAETAEIAVQAAQTGHLVLTTLHTNDAVSAITRLKDLGIPPFLISSSLLAVLGQRLVRTLCTKCRRKAPITESMKKRWQAALGSTTLPHFLFKAKGCRACNNTGYAGRTGIFELVTVNEAVRAMLSDDVPESVIKKKLRDLGVRTIVDAGIEKIEQGVTSPDELLRIVTIEDFSFEH